MHLLAVHRQHWEISLPFIHLVKLVKSLHILYQKPEKSRHRSSRGAWGVCPRLYLDQAEAWIAEKNFFGDWPHPLPLIVGSGWPGPPIIWRSGSAIEKVPLSNGISGYGPLYNSYIHFIKNSLCITIVSVCGTCHVPVIYYLLSISHTCMQEQNSHFLQSVVTTIS